MGAPLPLYDACARPITKNTRECPITHCTVHPPAPLPPTPLRGAPMGAPLPRYTACSPTPSTGSTHGCLPPTTTTVLTVAGLEVAVDEGDGGPGVQVSHPPGHLPGPVQQDSGGHPAPRQRPREGPPRRELHHQAEVGGLQADGTQGHHVGVPQAGVEPGLPPQAGRPRRPCVPPCRLHRHHLPPPGPPEDPPKAPRPDHLLQPQLPESRPRWAPPWGRGGARPSRGRGRRGAGPPCGGRGRGARPAQEGGGRGAGPPWRGRGWGAGPPQEGG